MAPSNQLSQQLSALDGVFLAFETPDTPGHIGGLAILDPSSHPQQDFGFDAFVDFVAERLALCPRFGWRLQHVPFGLDHPYWIDDEELDLRRHIRAIGLPSPGGMTELADVASYLFAKPLLPDQPLWEIFFIEGLQGGRTALLWKVHHCLMDGVSGAGLVELLFDLGPVPSARPLFPVDDRSVAGRPVGLLEMATRGLRNAADRPLAMLRHLSRIGTQTIEQLQTDGLAGVASAPRSPLNGVVGPRRSVAWSRISLERVKQLKNELDVTINDVVLALTSGAVRGYLERRDALPAESLVAAVPVSLRSADDKSMGNQVSEMGVVWGTHVADPLERVQLIHEASTRAKSCAKARRVNPLELMAETLHPAAMRLVARISAGAGDDIPLPSNAVVSNVPMSPVPLYIAGARLESLVPMSLLAPTQGFNITVVSYCGELHFGVIADPDLLDNVWEIADALPKALLELEAASAKEPRYRD
jgi:diacylglycerol O-acyltransferase